MKPPRFILYWPRIRSFRGYMIVAHFLWVPFVNAVQIVVWLLWAVVWLLWVLLWFMPKQLINKQAVASRKRKLNKAKARMTDYVG